MSDQPTPKLSAEARYKLRRLGIKPLEDIRICLKCRQPDEMVPRDREHPLTETLKRARIAFEHDRSNRDKQRFLHQVQSKMRHASRCCGKRMMAIKVDNHQAIWDRWRRRRELSPVDFEAQREALTLVVNPVSETAYHLNPQGQIDPDYLMMNALFGVSDHMVRGMIEVFREEDRRLEAAAAPLEAAG